MALIPIITIPDPMLRVTASPVGEVTDGLRQLLDDMAETMYGADGIGLAGPQISVSQRLVVMDCGGEETPQLYRMINPEIVKRSDERAVREEGCLSIPKHTADVERPAIVDVRYTDVDGSERVMTCEGLIAACVQHEIDHLNGVLFIDHISRLKRDMIVRRTLKDIRQSDSPNGE